MFGRKKTVTFDDVKKLVENINNAKKADCPKGCGIVVLYAQHTANGYEVNGAIGGTIDKPELPFALIEGLD